MSRRDLDWFLLLISFFRNKDEKDKTMTYKCPHCNTTEPLDFSDSASMNAENYGSKLFILECPKCEGKVQIYLSRRVELTAFNAAPKDADLSF